MDCPASVGDPGFPLSTAGSICLSRYLFHILTLVLVNTTLVAMQNEKKKRSCRSCEMDEDSELPRCKKTSPDPLVFLVEDSGVEKYADYKPPKRVIDVNDELHKARIRHLQGLHELAQDVRALDREQGLLKATHECDYAREEAVMPDPIMGKIEPVLGKHGHPGRPICNPSVISSMPTKAHLDDKRELQIKEVLKTAKDSCDTVGDAIKSGRNPTMQIWNMRNYDPRLYRCCDISTLFDDPWQLRNDELERDYRNMIRKTAGDIKHHGEVVGAFDSDGQPRHPMVAASLPSRHILEDLSLLWQVVGEEYRYYRFSLEEQFCTRRTPLSERIDQQQEQLRDLERWAGFPGHDAGSVGRSLASIARRLELLEQDCVTSANMRETLYPTMDFRLATIFSGLNDRLHACQDELKMHKKQNDELTTRLHALECLVEENGFAKNTEGIWVKDGTGPANEDHE